MYTASADDRLWLQSVQRKLYAQSRDHPDYRFDELWGLVTDPRNLRIAFARVQRNRGARTPGVDRITVKKILPQGGILSPLLSNVALSIIDGRYERQV